MERKGILLSVRTLLATVVFWSGDLTRSPGLVAAGVSSQNVSAPSAQATRSGVRNCRSCMVCFSPALPCPPSRAEGGERDAFWSLE